MRALCWHGKHQIRCGTVPDPQIKQPRDAITTASRCALCGSDLHLFDGFMPSVPGVYAGTVDRLPMGVRMKTGLALHTGQTHVGRWTRSLLTHIEEGRIDPSFVVTHTADLAHGPALYKTFRDKQDGCIKVVLKP